MFKRIITDLVIVVGVTSFFLAATLLSNYLHYGTFIFR